MMETPFNLDETDRLLSTTRAVRKRLDVDRPVRRELILDCIRLAQQAPSASNSQLWRWLVVDDPARKQAIADIYRRIREGVLDLQSRVAADDVQNQRVYESVLYLMDILPRMPFLVIPCLQQRPPPEADDCTVASAFGSIIPAVWNFQLALRARGLGSVYTTAHLRWEQDVADILGLPEHVMQVALLPVAYTRGVDFKPARRQAPEDIVHWNAWSGE